MGLLDLREHFGIWRRCGNTRFFRKNPENPWTIKYLNPLDGVLVAFNRTSFEGEEPKYTMVVMDAKKVGKKEIAKTFEGNHPWVKTAVERFFYYQALGWALDAVKKHASQPAFPGDPDIRNFLTFFQAGGELYESTGEPPSGDRPMLEETLEAILRTIGALSKAIVDYGRNLSVGDVQEALGEFGVLECE